MSIFVSYGHDTQPLIARLKARLIVAGHPAVAESLARDAGPSP